MPDKISKQIIGQDSVQRQICQAVEKGRLAHALLFSGPSGVGKRQMAWALAQKLLCEGLASPCGSCPSCLVVLKRQSEHVLCVTHETLQIRLRDVQAIPPFLSLQSFAKAKVVLIDSAEKMNLQAGNFLLKIIEEPPPRSFFFLISSMPSQLPLTIRSRVQTLRFQALPEALVSKLAEGVPAWMIRGCRGRMNLLEELRDQTEIRNRSLDMWSGLFDNSFSALQMDFPKKIASRKEALAIVRFWQQILRDARFFKSDHSDQLIHGDRKQDLKRLSRLASSLLDEWIKKTLEMEKDLQAGADHVLCFENAVIAMQKSLRQTGQTL